MKKTGLLVFLAVMVLANLPASGALLWNVPVTVTQPNGEQLRLLASGDEFFNWLHDARGYTIVQDPETGYYEYAVLNDGLLRPSGYPVTSVANVNDASIAFLQIPPGLKTAWEKRVQPKVMMPGGPADSDRIAMAPRTGTINNIVIFIRFSDEAEFTDAISTYNTMFNNTASGANSMMNYFREASYNRLTISTTFYPAPTTIVRSYQDSYPRSYYKPYNAATNPDGYSGGDSGSERRIREHTLLKNAITAVGLSVSSGLTVDGDGDGYVDNVCFIVSGGPTGWASLLWPHMWSLYSFTVNINGKRVYTYNFQLQTSLQSSGPGVLCHEMFHSLGAPDLYHYSYDGLQPAYDWDIMENNKNPPQHMSAYMKYKYGGWISSIPLITTSGVYTLNPLTSATGNCYRIASPNSTAQFFVIEYRKKSETFENSIPGSGAIIWRYDTRYSGNANGPPDELYAYRPGGTRTANGTPANANYGAHVSRTAINDTTNPSSFLQDGSAGGLIISNISAADGTITFNLNLIQYHLTITTGAGGTTNPAPADYLYDAGAEATITALPNSNYEFVNWSGSISNTQNPVTVTMDADKTIKANFRVKPKLIIQSSQYGTANPSPGEYYYATGTQVQVTAFPNGNCEFINWSGSISSTQNPVTVTMDADRTVKANFRVKPKLTIQSSHYGTTNPSPGEYYYATGTQVEVSAVSDMYYDFISWSGSATGSANPLSLTMDSNKTVTANFQLIHAPIATGRKVLNRTFSQAEYIDVLSWQADPANEGLNVTKYRIYTMGGDTPTLLVELAGDQIEYYHRKAGQASIQYAIVAVTSSGREGAPATITVQ